MVAGSAGEERRHSRTCFRRATPPERDLAHASSHGHRGHGLHGADRRQPRKKH